jgi:ribosomal protein S18 acetylase RimI-like enzyme
MTVRPGTDADLDAAHAVRERWAQAVDEQLLSATFFAAEWTQPDAATRDRMVAERDGAVVGYAYLRAGGDVVIRGEPEELARAVVERGRERGCDRLESVVTTNDEPTLAALDAAGFEREREVWRMWLDVSRPAAQPRLPADVSIRAYRDDDARPLHAFIEHAFAANNERILPFDEWLPFMTGHEDFDPAFFHVAESGGDIVACALTWKPFEWKGWLKDLAVHPEHRRRGLGGAMNGVAAAAYHEAGVERMGLKVDADNPTGAPRLYQRLGYERDRVYVVAGRALA